MSYSPVTMRAPDPIYVGTFSRKSLGNVFQSARGAGATSGAWANTNAIQLYQFSLSKPYSLARWWWLNGATVGTNYFQLGIYDQDFNLVKASPKTLSAGTANQIQYVSPGIAGTHITSGTDNTDATSYTTASVTLKTGVLYLLSVENSKASAAQAVSAITGGPTFTSRSTTTFNASTANRVSIWSAVPTSDYTGTLVIDFGGGNTQTGAVWSLDAFYHIDTASNDGVVQQAVGTGNSTTPLATLSAFSSANNATFGAFGNAGGAGGAPSAGYFELGEVSATTPAQALQTDYRPDNDTTVDETITSQQWGACALELKSLGTGAITIPTMRGYFGLWGNGTTATLFRISNVVTFQPYHYLVSAITSGLAPTVTPQADFGTIYVCGITSRSSP